MLETSPTMILRKDLRFFIGISVFVTLLLLQEQESLHYELNKTIDLHRLVSLRKAGLLDDQIAKVAALEKNLEESQGLFLTTSFPFQTSNLFCLYDLLNILNRCRPKELFGHSLV
jgi:hypothetical protein